MNIKYHKSVIFVRNITISRHFYEDQLGQKVEMDFGPYVEFKGGFALWHIDIALDMIPDQTSESEKNTRYHNHELYFETPDIETAFVHLSETYFLFIHPIHEPPWGQRSFRVYDPDGHIIEVGEPMSAVVLRFLNAGLSVEETAKRTGMQADVIRKIAETQTI